MRRALRRGMRRVDSIRDCKFAVRSRGFSMKDTLVLFEVDNRVRDPLRRHLSIGYQLETGNT